MPELSVIEQPLLDRYASAWDALVDQAPLPTPFLRSWWLEHTSCWSTRVRPGTRRRGARRRNRAAGGAPAGRQPAAVHGQRPALPGPPRSARRAGPGVGGRRRAPHVAGGARSCDRRLGRHAIGRARHGVLRRAGGDAVGCRRPTSSSTVRPRSQDGRPGCATPSSERTVGSPSSASRPRSCRRMDADRAFEALRSLHNERWGHASQFFPAIDRFEAAARIGMSRGELVIHELAVTERAGDRVIAVCVVFRVAGRASFYQAGRLTEPEWRGAGTAVLAASVEAAAAAGCHEYDLLRGDEPYKQDWSSGHRDVYRLVADVGGRRAGAVGAGGVHRRSAAIPSPTCIEPVRLSSAAGAGFLTPAGKRGGERDVNAPGRSADRSLRVVIAGGEAAGQRVLKGLATGGHDVVAAFAGSGLDGRSRAGRGGPPRRPGAPCRPGEGSVGGRRARPDRPARQRAQPVRDRPRVARLAGARRLQRASRLVARLRRSQLPELGRVARRARTGRHRPSHGGRRSTGATWHSRIGSRPERGPPAARSQWSARSGGSPSSTAWWTRSSPDNWICISRIHGAFTYFGREVPDDGHFRPERTAVELDRLVRACDYGPFTSPWGTLLADVGGDERRHPTGPPHRRLGRRTAGHDPP